MTIQSWFRGLTPGSKPKLKKSRRLSPRTLDNRYWPCVERLEDRTLMAYDLALAFGFGSTETENANAVAVDASGNVLVTGTFTSPSFDLDPGPGVYLLSNAGGYDGYAAKFDPAGNLLWGIGIGGTATEQMRDAALDGSGSFFVTGIFAGSIEIGAPGQPHITLSNGGISEGFLAKIDQHGNALWATTFGATADPRIAAAITTDEAGNVYATGHEGDGGYRLFVAKYDADGAAVWTKVVSDGTGTYYPSAGSTSYAIGTDIAVDANSNVYVTGEYLGKIDFNPSATKTNQSKTSTLSSAGSRLAPSDDAFVLKLNATGAYVWAGSMGGSSIDFGKQIAVDGTGNVYVSGGFYSNPNDFNPGSGTLNLTTTGGLSTFLVKLDPNRNLIWGRRIAGSGGDMALDAMGNVYSTGYFSGTIDANPGAGTFNLTAGGSNDVLVSKLNSSGSFVWAADILRGEPSFSGSSAGLAVDGSGNIYTTGWFRGTADFDPGVGTYSLPSALDSTGYPTMDAFVSKLVPSSSAESTAAATDAALMLFLTDDLTLPSKRK